jgi:asparagine N-glycosylation enzyme membrane subunit Stt3
MDSKSLAKTAKIFTKKYWYLLVLLAIVLMAFWVRSFPARFSELQALDPMYMYRISEYVLE